MEEIEATKVREVTTTSSPLPKFSALNATSRANVPFANATAYFDSDQVANSYVKEYINRQFDWVQKKFKAKAVVEKTCANSLRIPFINQIIPNATYVYIVRDGLDVVGSAKLRWTANLNIKYTLKKARFIPIFDLPFYFFNFFINRLHKFLSSQNRLSFWGPRFKGLDNLL